jgi:hypothetical protein
LPALRSRKSVPRALTRAAIFSAALAGCQTKSKAPNPTAGSAIEVGSSAQVVAPADAAAPTPVADAAEGSAAAVAADAAVADIDAGTGSAASALQKKGKTTRFDPQNPDAKRRKQELEERQMAKPYGAPPARRRVV